MEKYSGISIQKIAKNEKVIFKSLAKLLSSAESGNQFIDKDTLEDKDMKEQLVESDDPGQLLYEAGFGAHFDIESETMQHPSKGRPSGVSGKAYEMTSDGKDVIIEFADDNDNMQYVKLSDVIKKFETGEWLVLSGETEPEDSKPLIAQLKTILARL